MSDTGGRLEITGFETTPDGTFTKASSAEHRAVIDQLATTVGPNGKSAIANIKVMTGEPIKVNGRNRGKDERVDEVMLRNIAKQLGFGLRVDHSLLSDGRTNLRVQIQPKREFSAEAIASRKQKLEAARALKRAAKDREKKAAEAAAAAKAQPPKPPVK